MPPDARKCHKTVVLALDMLRLEDTKNGSNEITSHKRQKMTLIQRTCTVSLLALGLGLSGCSDYTGRYSDGTPTRKFIDVNSDSITVGAFVDGSLVCNDGKIENTTKSTDGKTVTLTGKLDYSTVIADPSREAGAVVRSAKEGHWTTPFTATINTESNTLTFQGQLIVNSLEAHPLNVTLAKSTE